jgi:hypothetical protein
MKTAALTDLELRAVDALRALLGRISGVRLREMKCTPRHRNHAIKFVAQVEVFGHAHTLACGVHAPESASQLRAALRQLNLTAANFAAGATPVLIAPRLSSEAQSICRESSAAFLDFDGNARLFVGEAFILMRSLPCLGAERRPSPPPHAAVGPASPGANHPLPASPERLAIIA